MAAQTVNDAEARQELARTASCEIISLANMLKRECRDECFDDILRGALVRIDDLGSVVLSVLGGDDGYETTDMHKLIFGRPMTV